MSSSSSKQSTAQTDNRRVLGQGAVSAENSNVTLYNQTLDGDVVNRAFDFGADALNFGTDALNFGNQTVTRAMNFGADALSFANAASNRAAQTSANAVADALGFAESANVRSQQLAYNTVTDALASNESAFGKALTTVNTATGRALDTFTATNELVKDAYADAKGRGALTDQILMGAIAAMALVAFFAVKK